MTSIAYIIQKWDLSPTLFIFGFKVTQICKILLFCLGDLYFQTVDVLRGRATTDIIVIYIFLLPWSRGWV